MGAARLPAPRRPGREPAGGDRRPGLPHRPPDLVVLSARFRPTLGHGRVALRRRGRRRPAPARARGGGSPARGRSAASPRSRARRTACSRPVRTRAGCRATRPGGSGARSRPVASPSSTRGVTASPASCCSAGQPPQPHNVLRRRLLEALVLIAIVDAVGNVPDVALRERRQPQRDPQPLGCVLLLDRAVVDGLVADAEPGDDGWADRRHRARADRSLPRLRHRRRLRLVLPRPRCAQKSWSSAPRRRAHSANPPRRSSGSASSRTARMSRAATRSPHSGQARCGIATAPQCLCWSVIASTAGVASSPSP